MNQKELKELIDFLIERDISEFELQRGDEKVRIKRGVPVSASPAAPLVATLSPPPQTPSATAHVPGSSWSPARPAGASPSQGRCRRRRAASGTAAWRAAHEP